MSDLDVRIRKWLDLLSTPPLPDETIEALRAVLAECDEAEEAGCDAISLSLIRAAIARELGIEVSP